MNRCARLWYYSAFIRANVFGMLSVCMPDVSDDKATGRCDYAERVRHGGPRTLQKAIVHAADLDDYVLEDGELELLLESIVGDDPNADSRLKFERFIYGTTSKTTTGRRAPIGTRLNAVK